jgi:hypothetical protein
VRLQRGSGIRERKNAELKLGRCGSVIEALAGLKMRMKRLVSGDLSQLVRFELKGLNKKNGDNESCVLQNTDLYTYAYTTNICLSLPRST